MTRRHVAAIIVFLAVGLIVHQPGESTIETGVIAALAAGLFLVMVEAWRGKM